MGYILSDKEAPCEVITATAYYVNKSKTFGVINIMHGQNFLNWKGKMYLI